MSGTVLLVDDEPLIREYLTVLLLHHGFRSVACVDGPSALRHLSVAGDEISLVFSDISMGGMSGIEFLTQVRTFAPDLPFVLLSGSCDEPLAVDAYRAGASDYLLKPVAEQDFIDLVKKHSHSRDARDIGPAKDVPERLLQLFKSLEMRRFETMQHSQRVAAYCRLIAINFGLPRKQLSELEVGALLHDIGKVAVPQNVIEKPGRLTDDEWRVMKLHPAIGARLLWEVAKTFRWAPEYLRWPTRWTLFVPRGRIARPRRYRSRGRRLTPWQARSSTRRWCEVSEWLPTRRYWLFKRFTRNRRRS